VKLLAPAPKTTLFTVVAAESDTPELFETPKVAISLLPFGTVAGVQFAAVFQSLLDGLRFQVALPAWASRMKEEVRVKKMISLVFMFSNFYFPILGGSSSPLLDERLNRLTEQPIHL